MIIPTAPPMKPKTNRVASLILHPSSLALLLSHHVIMNAKKLMMIKYVAKIQTVGGELSHIIRSRRRSILFIHPFGGSF